MLPSNGLTWATLTSCIFLMDEYFYINDRSNLGSHPDLPKPLFKIVTIFFFFKERRVAQVTFVGTYTIEWDAGKSLKNRFWW